MRSTHNSRRPTQVDVARLAGVSRQTVSLVVQGDPRVSQEKRDAVHAAMHELAYRPNVNARALASGGSGLIGVVISDFTNYFHAELAEALHRMCEERDFIPVMVTVQEKESDERAAIARFEQLSVDGLVLVSPMLSYDELEKLAKRVPTAVLTRHEVPPTCVSACVDETMAARQIVAHAQEQGYRSLLYAGYDRRVRGDSSHIRRDAYIAAGREVGIFVHTVDVRASRMREALAKLLEKLPDPLIYCHNDLVALEISGIVQNLGYEIGTHVGIVGFDNTKVAALPGVALTSVDQNIAKLAEHTVKNLEKIVRFFGKEDTDMDLRLLGSALLPAKLVVRNSTIKGR